MILKRETISKLCKGQWYTYSSLFFAK